MSSIDSTSNPARTLVATANTPSPAQSIAPQRSPHGITRGFQGSVSSTNVECDHGQNVLGNGQLVQDIGQNVKGHYQLESSQKATSDTHLENGIGQNAEGNSHKEDIRRAVELVREASRVNFRSPPSSPHASALASFNFHSAFEGAPSRDVDRLEKYARENSRYIADSSDGLTLKEFIRKQFACSCHRDVKRSRHRLFDSFDLIIIVLIGFAVLLSTPARSYLNVLAGWMILSDPSLMYSVTRHSQVLYFSAIATAIGRLSTGFLIDNFDPIIWFGVFVLGSATAVMLVSELDALTVGDSSHQKLIVLRLLVAIDSFFQSGIFACVVRFIHDHFRPSQWGTSLVLAAIGGRIGSIISILAMGAIVTTKQSWTVGARIVSILCFTAMVPLLTVKCFPHPSTSSVAPSDADFFTNLMEHDASAPPASRINIGMPKCDSKSRKKTYRHCCAGLRRILTWWQRPSFFLMACANAGMAVALSPEGLEGLFPLFTTKALNTTPGLPTGTVTMFTHLGAIFSLILGGLFLEKLTRSSLARMNLLLMFIGCCALAGLTGLASVGVRSMQNLSNQGRACYFFLGFGFGYPSLVTVNKFAIHFGGDHSALVVQTLSLFALAVCAGANSLFGVFASISWILVAGLVLLISLIGLLAMIIFDFHEWRTKRKLRRKNLENLVHEVLAQGDPEAIMARSRPYVIQGDLSETSLPKLAKSSTIAASTSPSATESRRVKVIPNPRNDELNRTDSSCVVREFDGTSRASLSNGASAGIERQASARDDADSEDSRTQVDEIAEQQEAMSNRRVDSSHRGVSMFMSVLSSLVVLLVIVGMFVSYYWSRVTVKYYDQATRPPS